MDAIQVLKAQHQEVDELFSQFEKARTRKMDIARQICEKGRPDLSSGHPRAGRAAP